MTEDQAALLARARVARLATCDGSGRPHCVPVCFVWNGQAVLIALDEKPKTVDPRDLRRVRNLQENPRACLLVDHYQEDWSGLWFLMVEGEGRLVPLSDPDRERLRDKYPQYRSMRLVEAIRLDPTRVVAWSGAGQSLA